MGIFHKDRDYTPMPEGYWEKVAAEHRATLEANAAKRRAEKSFVVKVRQERGEADTWEVVELPSGIGQGRFATLSEAEAELASVVALQEAGE